MKNRKSYIATIAMAVLLGFGLSIGCGYADQAKPGPSDSPQVTITVVPAPTSTNNTVATKPTPQDLYHRVWKIAKDDFLWQDRLTNFDQWEHKYDGQLATQADAEKAINDMLDTLKDGYTYFRDNGATQNHATATASKNVVTYRMIGTVGYIKISTFGSENTASETEAAIRALNKLGAKAYVVDLRNNGGGYVSQAFAMTAMFIDGGEFATMKGMKGGSPYTEVMTVTKTTLEDKENGVVTSNNARVPNLTGNKPVIILVNGGSASASEMFAGALRDHGRAKLLGSKTFGKGISQLNIDLEFNTSMQVTFAKLYQPAGGCIHAVGMMPDYVLLNQPKVDTQLDSAVKLVQQNPKARP